jgi:segregation and condensation protein B
MDGSIRVDDRTEPEHGRAGGMSEELRILEALLFAAGEPVDETALGRALPEAADVPALLVELASHYQGRGVALSQIAGKWAFRTAPDLASFLEMEVKVARRLSRAAVETLAIIAYHQPITRGEVEEIRGVALSRGTLDLLLELSWIRPMGRRRTPGRPVTWGTSPGFLEQFNLNALSDLPGVDELKAAGLLDTRPVRTIFGEIAAADSEENSGDSDDEDDVAPDLADGDEPVDAALREEP